MKIHIVQKGDTLWKIAKKYGVNFEELKSMNSQLSNPDMIMPGMKIKVPTGGVPVKKEAPMQQVPVKEAPKAVHPYAEMPPVTLPVVEEVKKEQPKVVSPAAMEMPKPPYVPPVPQVYHPQQEIDVNNYYMVNMAMTQAPQLPPKPANVLPGMMKPEEESPESVELPVEQPAPPVYQQPCPPPIFNPCAPPCPPPPCCGPVPTVFPGAGYNYPMQPYGYPYGYPQAVNPAMMPSMPYMPGMESPESLESSPESIEFNYPKHPAAFAPTQVAPQAMPYGYQPGAVQPQMAPPYGGRPDLQDPQMAAPIGYQGPQAVPSDPGCVPVSPVLPGSGLGSYPYPYGYQPYYGVPQAGVAQPFVPSYPGGAGYVPGAMQPQPYMQGYGMGYPGVPMGSVQPGYSMYPYGYQRQEYDDESSEF